MAGEFGATAMDDARGGRFGLDLPARNRLLFERAGWVFVEPKPELTRAAVVTRATVNDAETVQQVFMDRSGNIQITTDVVTVQCPGELSEAASVQRIRADGLRILRRLPFAPNTFETSSVNQRPLPELIAELQAKPHYVFAEPMLLQAITGRLRPTDPEYGSQWQHLNDGSNGGVAGADIHSEAAWDRTLGGSADRPIRIAVIDNGMEVKHPDLRTGIVGGCHFQSNGLGSATFVRFEPGMLGFPNNAHGTGCMGMAGARANNGVGGCGSAPHADLLAIACMNDQIGTQATLARAVAYSADPSREDAEAGPADGADVIACSLGPNGADWDLTSVLELAIQFAATQSRGGRGVPIFWAASNGHFEVSRDEICSLPDVIAVGRSNRSDLSDGSAFGPKLEFLAPGAEVFNATTGGRYRFWTGTSFAAPLAAGVGALVLALNPRLTAGELRARLRETCDKIGGVEYDANGRHDEYGFGRINAERAVLAE
jgi:thermitase